MTKKAIFIAGVAGLAVLYIAGPILAGATRKGDREGPVLYPEGFHTALYIIGHEAVFQEKPRQRLDSWMFKRPWFYGMPRRLKSHTEREAYIEMAKRNHSPRVEWLIKMNEGTNQAVEVMANKFVEQQH